MTDLPTPFERFIQGILPENPVYRQLGVAACHSLEPGFIERYSQEDTTPLGWLPGMKNAPPPAHGFAWACRRSILQDVQFYDACILGGGDSAIFMGAIGKYDIARNMLGMSAPHASHYRDWASRFYEAIADYGVSYTPGTIYHLWHGARANRRYKDRHDIARNANFNPPIDLSPSAEGPWSWSDRDCSMRRELENYFSDRQEDNR